MDFAMTTGTARLGAFSHATVGVANLEHAISFWQGPFGFEVVKRREGPDAALATLWGLKSGDITRQAIVRNPARRSGSTRRSSITCRRIWIFTPTT